MTMLCHLAAGLVNTTTQRAGGGRAGGTGGSAGGAEPAGADLAEVLRGAEYLALGGGHVLPAPGHHEDRLLAAHRRLDVRVRLRSQRLDLRPCVHHPVTHA